MDFILYSYNCILVFLSFRWQARSAAISTREIFRGWQVEHLPQIAGQSAVEASSLQDLKIYSHSHTYFVEREVFKLIFTNLRFHKVFITRSKDIYSLHHTHFTLQTLGTHFITRYYSHSRVYTLVFTNFTSHTFTKSSLQDLRIFTPRSSHTSPHTTCKWQEGPHAWYWQAVSFSCFFRFHCY